MAEYGNEPGGLADMAQSPEEAREACGIGEPPTPPKYPYGLCICLTNNELDKLGLEGDCNVGDQLHVNAVAEVTSVSKRQEADGKECIRIEMQITKMGLREDGEGPDANDGDTDEDDRREYTSEPRRRHALYGEDSYKD